MMKKEKTNRSCLLLFQAREGESEEKKSEKEKRKKKRHVYITAARKCVIGVLITH